MSNFEELFAKKDMLLSDVLQIIDYVKYFELSRNPLPTDDECIAHYLIQEKIIVKQDNGLYSVTNLGALLFANKLSQFGNLSRKGIRITKYADSSKITTSRAEDGRLGYATGFENLLKYIDSLLPKKEEFVGGFRRSIPVFLQLHCEN